MPTFFRVFVLSAFFVISAVSSFAWDDTGHKAVAFIAWQQMSPATREAVIKILRTAPEDSDLSAFYLTSAEPEDTRKLAYFMLAATWADIVRDRAFETRNKKYHKSNWHYDDIFWKQVNGKAEVLPKPEDGGQAVSRLVEFDKLLRNASASDKDKAIAIAWVEHLIGDIHQPLHTSARVTDKEPKGDQGGNLFLLTPENTPRDKQLNLHWFWDSIIDRNTPLKGDTCERDYIADVAGKIMKKYPRRDLASEMKPGAFDEWRAESVALSQTEVFSPDLVRFQSPSEKYKKKAFQVSQRRMALAGYRLGEILNQIFGTPAPPAVR
ncbi:MAG TPA: S1/P1 nuclease [Pyrinomonadaceae bacterium]|nr:S1/P1 nuclease [Pyrinomonadaceae bacterium]